MHLIDVHITLEGCLKDIRDCGGEEDVPEEDSKKSRKDGGLGMVSFPPIFGKVLEITFSLHIKFSVVHEEQALLQTR